MSELIGAFAITDPTKAQRMAFPFALSAVTRGLTQSGGLAEYRSGGGAIRTADWNSLFQSSFQAAGWRESVRDVPLHWTIPEHMFTEPEAPVDWSTKYTFKAKVEYFDLDTERWEQKWVSSGFDELPTHAEWRADALRRMEQEWESPRVRDIEEVRFISEETWKRRYP